MIESFFYKVEKSHFYHVHMRSWRLKISERRSQNLLRGRFPLRRLLEQKEKLSEEFFLDLIFFVC